MNRLGLKIACLVASVVIWVQVASNTTVEQNAKLSLVIPDLGENLTLEGSQLPSEILVRLEGSKLRLFLHHFFQSDVGEVRINPWDWQPGPGFTVQILPEHVFSDLKVVGINPRVLLEIEVDRQEYRLLPIVQENIGELRDDLAFLEPPQLKPDSVLVAGPSRFFLENTEVVAEPVDFSRLRGSERLTVSLTQPGDFLHLVTRQVSLDCQVAKITDRTLANISVIPLVDSGMPQVGVSPPLVDVMVRGVADSVAALSANRLLVTVSVGTREEGIYQLPGQIDSPDWLEIIGLDPPEFQVIVGRPSVSLDSLYKARGLDLQGVQDADE